MSGPVEIPRICAIRAKDNLSSRVTIGEGQDRSTLPHGSLLGLSMGMSGKKLVGLSMGMSGKKMMSSKVEIVTSL